MQKVSDNKLTNKLYLHVCNIPKFIEGGQENVLLVFIIKFYLQTTIYSSVAKFNGMYLFHMIIRSL